MSTKRSSAHADGRQRATSRNAYPLPSADGQTDGDLLRDLAQQTNEALKALLKRIEALENSASSRSTTTPAVVINVGSGASIGVSTESDNEPRMGFKSK